MNLVIPKCCDDEQWLSIPDFEGRYIVSSCGRILGLSRPVMSKHGTTYNIPTRLLKGTTWGNGYQMISLGDGHKKHLQGLHRLVLSAFVSPCPEGMQACHYDGDKQNNHLTNLRWDTAKANRKEQTRHGTAQRGDKHGRSPLINADVLEIRRLGNLGIPQRAIAKQFGISQPAISKIIRHETWSHI